jgi:hypothetical protein
MSQSNAQILQNASIIPPAETDASKGSTIQKKDQAFGDDIAENVLKESCDERQMRKRRRLFVKNKRGYWT